MTATSTMTDFGSRGLVQADVIARFEFSRRDFVISRTENDQEYWLAIDQRTIMDCFALVSVDEAGTYAGHQGRSSILGNDEIATLARMAGWKILTYRQRRSHTPRLGRR